MKIHEFLRYHGVERNPFAEEDADSDLVFKKHCVLGTYHPAWGKIFGDPEDSSTSAVFGEKGSGKTALRIQITEAFKRFNRENLSERVFVIEYDDFNPYLDRFAEKFGGRKRDEEELLSRWRLWDHMDAILCLGVTRLVDEILSARRHAAGDDAALSVEPRQLKALSSVERRDLLLLAALYDRTTSLPPKTRWQKLRRRVRFRGWSGQWDRVLGVVGSALSVGASVYWGGAAALLQVWPWAGVALSWLPTVSRWLHGTRTAWQVVRELRVLPHQVDALRFCLLKLGKKQLENQPIPRRNQSVDRYELLKKFQTVLAKLGFRGITVLVDRVDEPHLLGGAPNLMRAFVWPLLDNKFLSHPGLGVKLLLPAELTRYLSQEDQGFYERSRLDKQNLVRSLEWSGESLYDVASDRLNACRTKVKEGRLSLRDLFEPEVSETDIIAALGQIRVPRHLFKFLHRLLVEHCNRYTDDSPAWRISPDTFRACHSLYLQDMEARDHALTTG
ncbi:MAG: hypothetical protein O7J95_10425 [Planctomycetota bacterium]|nr:hypothetical protein [Planctomycetota bacterium]